MKFVNDHVNRYPEPIERDSQIVRVPLENMDWCARKSAMPTSVKNEQRIKHVNNEK